MSIFTKKTFVTLLLLTFSSFAFSQMNFPRQGLEDYPKRQYDRPGIMPQGMFELRLTADANKDFKPLNLGFDATLGLLPRYQLSIGFPKLRITKEDDQSRFLRVFNLDNKIKLYSLGLISQSLYIGLPVNVDGGEIIKQINLSAPISVGTNSYGVKLLKSDFIELHLRPKAALKLNFNTEFSFQVANPLYMSLGTKFGSLHYFKNPTKEKYELEPVFIWKEPNAELGLSMAFTKWFDTDVFFGVSNFKKFKETFSFGVSLAFRGGRIFG